MLSSVLAASFCLQLFIVQRGGSKIIIQEKLRE
ncbi:Protein of unknown function [Gryllus bimaculatus]|nr:Protein of unknown function [Gryllus bimaculatus]